MDGASDDGTREILVEEFKRLDKSIFKLKLQENRNGYGFDIIEGLKLASHDVLAWTHADMQTDLSDVLRGFELFELEKNFGYSSVTFWTSLIVAGGIPPLLIFYFMILGALIYKKDTRFYGFMLLILSMTKGDVFQLYLWTSITTAYSLSHLPNFNKGFFVNKNHEA